MAIKWKAFLHLSQMFLAIALLLLAISLFLPSFTLTQEAESSDGDVTQTYDFYPWNFKETLDSNIDNKSAKMESREEAFIYTNGRLSTITMAVGVLLVVSVLGPMIILFLTFKFDPLNRKKNMFSLLLFFSIFFSLVIIASIFFFIVPQYIFQELATPIGYNPSMPLPALGSQQGEYIELGVGSELDPLIGHSEMSDATFKVSWAPGMALYLYIASAILMLASFRFFTKAHSMALYEVAKKRRLAKEKKEEKKEDEEEDEEEDGEDEIVIAEIEEVFDEVLTDLESGSVEEAPKKKKGKKSKAKAKKKSKKETPSQELEDQGAKVEVVPEVESEPDMSEPAEEEIKIEEDLETPSSEHLNKPASKETKIIEIGSKDFEKTEVTIDEDNAVTIECPMCSNSFIIDKNEKYVVCTTCGFTGDVG